MKISGYLFVGLVISMVLQASFVFADRNPCDLLTKEQIASVIREFGFKKARYVDGRNYFAGQSCDYFGNGKTVTITIEEKGDFLGGKNIFSSAKEKFERQKKAAAPGVITSIKGIGEEAIWNHVSLEFLQDGTLYTIRVHAGKGLRAKNRDELRKKVEKRNLEYSKELATIILLNSKNLHKN